MSLTLPRRSGWRPSSVVVRSGEACGKRKFLDLRKDRHLTRTRYALTTTRCSGASSDPPWGGIVEGTRLHAIAFPNDSGDRPRGLVARVIPVQGRRTAC